MKERIWTWLKLHTLESVLSHSRTPSGTICKAVSPLPLPDRHSDSSQLRQEKPGTAPGQARGKKAQIFFYTGITTNEDTLALTGKTLLCLALYTRV